MCCETRLKAVKKIKKKTSVLLRQMDKRGERKSTKDTNISDANEPKKLQLLFTVRSFFFLKRWEGK